MEPLSKMGSLLDAGFGPLARWTSTVKLRGGLISGNKDKKGALSKTVVP